MFSEQLKKILNLIKRTGDRVVIFDANTPNDSYVIMDIDRYTDMLSSEKPELTKKGAGKNIAVEPEKEELAPINKEKDEKKENLTEEDLTDKINREISMWKNRENSVYLGEDNSPKKVWSIPSKVKDKAQEIE